MDSPTYVLYLMKSLDDRDNKTAKEAQFFLDSKPNYSQYPVQHY